MTNRPTSEGGLLRFAILTVLLAFNIALIPYLGLPYYPLSVTARFMLAYEPGCTPPASGDWTISSDCLLSSSATAPGNVIVQDGVTLTIGSGVILDIDLSQFGLRLGNGARVVIQPGGSIR